MEQTMGKRIAQNRKRLGLTQDALAEKLGVTAQAISKWENDQSCPDITMLPRLAEIFGVTTDELLGVKKEKVHEAEVVTEEDSEQEPKNRWEFRWDVGRSGSIAFAVLVLLVGALSMLDAVKQWDVGFWSILWPSALLVYGFAGLFRKFSFFNLGCSLFGGYFLARNFGIWHIDVSSRIVFPAIILLFGISLLVDAVRKPKRSKFHVSRNGVKLCDENGSPKKGKNEYTVDGEGFEYDFAFGDGVQNVALPVLSKGEVNMSFGELILDLTGCGKIADGCSLEANCSFGDLVILVPKNCRVLPESSTSFASFSIVGEPDAEPVATIYLEGNVSFGEIVVKYI